MNKRLFVTQSASPMSYCQNMPLPGAVVRFPGQSTARTRLFCFPYAGAGGAAFADWPPYLSDVVELIALTLPGREARFGEGPLESVAAAVQDIGQSIVGLLERPFAFFGHSLGALVAFETARWLRRGGLESPELLIVSGALAPHAPRRSQSVHKLPVDSFVSELRRFNGTPGQILENPDLMNLVLPAIRADFMAFENYTFIEEQPLSCSLVTFAGRMDREAPPADMLAWRQHTIGNFDSFVFPGEHFFVKSERSAVLQTIVRCLKSLATEAPLD